VLGRLPVQLQAAQAAALVQVGLGAPQHLQLDRVRRAAQPDLLLDDLQPPLDGRQVG